MSAPPSPITDDYAALAELAGGFIHEIKNHLNTLNLNLQLLGEDFEDPQSQRERRALTRVQKLQGELLAGPQAYDLPTAAKKATLLALGVAYQKYIADLENQQEILAALCDMAMNAFAMESAVLRAQKMGEPETVKAMLDVWLRDAMDVVAVSGRTVLAACAEGDTLRTQMAALRRFTKYEPVDRIGLQRKVAARMLAAERFTVA